MVLQEKEVKTEQQKVTTPYSYYGYSAPVVEEPTLEEVPFDDGSFDFETEYSKVDAPTYEKQEHVLPSYTFKRDKTVEQKQEQTIVATSEVQPQAHLSARAKIILSVMSIVACMLVAFAIYNAVSISALGYSVAEKSAVYASMQEEVGALEETYNGLASDETINNQLGDLFVNGDSEIVLPTMPERDAIVYETPTNWFDRLCEWFSNLF